MGSELQMAGGVASVGSTVLALSAATGPAAPFVAAGGAVLSLLGSLFSRPDKFLQNAYPVMLRQAQSSGYNVYAFWFGDMMEVTPSGQHGTAIVGSGRPQPELLDEIAQSQGNTPWYSARCTRADDDSPAENDSITPPREIT